AGVEVHRPPIRMTLRAGARLERLGGLHVRVGVVTGAARARVGVARRVERGEQRPHLVAAEALTCTGAEQAGSRIRRYELRLGGETVAGQAIELLFVGDRRRALVE